jgi:NADPH2:quinone reductase
VRAAVIVNGHLQLQDRPTPTPRGRQVLVDVAATGVNRADLLQRAGRYLAPAGVPADIPGLELAGRVAAVGPDAQGWQEGDRVMALVAGGAHAGSCLVEDDQLIAVPDALDDVTAGSCMEVFATAHDAMVSQAGLRAGDTVLVHAVGSGVGTAAVQLATALGARVIGTTRTAAKLAHATALGMAGGVVIDDPTDRAVAAQIAELGAPDVVLDLVGGEYVALDVRVAAPGARIMVVGLLAGGSTSLPLGALLAKRLTVRGTVLRSRSAAEKVTVARRFEHEVVPLLTGGRIAPVIARTFPLDEAEAAYDAIATDEIVGKVVLTA